MFCCGFNNSSPEVSPYVVHIILVMFWLLSGHLLGKELLHQLTICSLCNLIICNFSGVVWKSRELKLLCDTLYQLSPRLLHCIKSNKKQ